MDTLRDALRRGDEAKAVGLIISVKEVAHLGMCLLTACETGHLKCAQLLLAAHAAVDQADRDGATPLIAACIKGHGDCVQLLLGAHAAVDQANSDRETPLYAACDKGHGVCAQLLLFSQAAVDAADSNGRTPLIAACDKGHGDCAQVLLAAHAAVDQADSDGCTPLYVACLHGHCDIVQLLLGAHAALDQAEKIGYTPLFAACVEGHDGCAQLLLAARAAVDQAEGHGITSLNVACIKDHGDCAQLLLAAHAAIDRADSNGMTPLISACFAGSIDIVKLLVHAGARTDLRSVSGTALELAEARGHTVIARFLRSFLRLYSSSRRAPSVIAAVAPMSIAERAAAERAAELAAAALLAEEEEAEGAPKQQAQKKKASKKAKAKQAWAKEARAPVASALAAASGSADADDEMLAAADDKGLLGPAPSAAANEALRVAMTAEQYEGLIGAIEEHHARASEGVMAEARAMRERLHKKRKQESQKLRRKHAEEIEMLDSVSKLSLLEVKQSPPAAGSASAEAASASVAPEAPSAPPAAVALTLAELTAATDGFGEQRLIGSGGYGRVFTADALSSLRPEALPLWLRHKPVAVKRAKSGVYDLADLQREVSVLQQCSHPHLLPLLGYYLEHEAPPCLVFPLMRGGSLADRLWPKEADPEYLRRLGLGASLIPLMWHQRLRILRQAADALLYLHTPVPGGKGAVVHRDFKPENILLDDELNAYLADTGFAKMDAGPEASKMKSASNALYLTRGYLDPSVVEGGAYSATTDGWALGITLLVTLTGRSPLSIITKCEEDFDEDFVDIDAAQLADASAGWPALAVAACKDAVRSAASGLCHSSVRKRLTVAAALAILTSLADEDGSSGTGCVTLGGSALSSSEHPVSTAADYVPTPLSMQVREMRKGSDAHKGIKDNVLLAFSSVMCRLDAIYAARAAKAPEGFEERIKYWHRECGMRTDLKDRLHTFRIWRNAASHLDDDRWRRDGPRDEAEALQLVSAVKTAIEALEGASPRKR
jgi:interleukin-1 receptor-associated kinase 1